MGILDRVRSTITRRTAAGAIGRPPTPGLRPESAEPRSEHPTARSTGAWRRAEPTQLVSRRDHLATAPFAFPAGLTTRRQPIVLAPLEHGVPAHGIARSISVVTPVDRTAVMSGREIPRVPTVRRRAMEPGSDAVPPTTDDVELTDGPTPSVTWGDEPAEPTGGPATAADAAGTLARPDTVRPRSAGTSPGVQRARTDPIDRESRSARPLTSARSRRLQSSFGDPGDVGAEPGPVRRTPVGAEAPGIDRSAADPGTGLASSVAAATTGSEPSVGRTAAPRPSTPRSTTLPTSTPAGPTTPPAARPAAPATGPRPAPPGAAEPAPVHMGVDRSDDEPASSSEPGASSRRPEQPHRIEARPGSESPAAPSVSRSAASPSPQPTVALPPLAPQTDSDRTHAAPRATGAPRVDAATPKATTNHAVDRSAEPIGETAEAAGSSDALVASDGSDDDGGTAGVPAPEILSDGSTDSEVDVDPRLLDGSAATTTPNVPNGDRPADSDAPSTSDSDGGAKRATHPSLAADEDASPADEYPGVAAPPVDVTVSTAVDRARAIPPISKQAPVVPATTPGPPDGTPSRRLPPLTPRPPAPTSPSSTPTAQRSPIDRADGPHPSIPDGIGPSTVATTNAAEPRSVDRPDATPSAAEPGSVDSPDATPSAPIVVHRIASPEPSGASTTGRRRSADPGESAAMPDSRREPFSATDEPVSQIRALEEFLVARSTSTVASDDPHLPAHRPASHTGTSIERSQDGSASMVSTIDRAIAVSPAPPERPAIDDAAAVDRMTEQVYRRVRRRLRADLQLDRERKGGALHGF